MTLDELNTEGVAPALLLLPQAMTSPEARVLLFAIALQESGLVERAQVVYDGQGNEIKGPARGWWQFEIGSRSSGGGVWGVYQHPASRYWLNELCKDRGIPFFAASIWAAIENDDVLAAGLARLLIFTDPRKLPALIDVQGAWALYANRCWRPGKPRPKDWANNHFQAVAYVTQDTSSESDA